MDNSLSRYIAKNSKKRNSGLKYDFMPSLLEIIERPSHIAGTIIIVTIALLLAAAIIWANFSRLDVVVNGMGNIIPEGKLVELKPLIGGKVKEVNVRVGDYIGAGEVLVSLENESANIDLEQLRYNVEWCAIQREITEERLKNDEYNIPIDKYDAKFSNGLNEISLEIDIYKDEKTQRQKDLDEARKELAEAISEEDEYLTSTLESRVASYEEDIISSDKSMRSQAYGKLFSLDQEMQAYDLELAKFNISDEEYRIKSPVNGYVNMLSVISPGQTVTAGDPVVSIVPSDEAMQFECYVADKDRSEIEIGMNVSVKLTVFSFSDYGAVTGKVTYISPSSFTDETYGNVYVVDIDIDEEQMHPDIDLISGLSGNVEIITGKRTVMQYFLEPITKGLGESLKEN
jgi:multidrug efflux pump subunit AcrA (membrane-fusion protein)